MGFGKIGFGIAPLALICAAMISAYKRRSPQSPPKSHESAKF